MHNASKWNQLEAEFWRAHLDTSFVQVDPVMIKSHPGVKLLQ